MTMHEATAPSGDRVRKALAMILHRAKLARHDPCAFFEFVMRDELSGEALKVAPHQRIAIEFVMAHPQCVLLMPVGTSKTFLSASIGLYLIGHDHELRGAFLSATQEQAAKPLKMMRDYIDGSVAHGSDRLRMVFPDLGPGRRRTDVWRDTKIIVDRRGAVRDATVAAYGSDSSGMPGSRLNFIIVDDLLNYQNTNTLEQREKSYDFMMSTAYTRLDPSPESRFVVSNTSWHPDDVPHRLQQEGWPTLRMDLLGEIEVTGTAWDPSDEHALRPAFPGSMMCRLAAHDPDPNGEVTLWPERYSDDAIAKLREKLSAIEFNRAYRNICRDDDSAACKVEWIDLCKTKARARGYFDYVSELHGANTFTGVDLAIGLGEEHDMTCLFTFEAMPDGCRRILEIQLGRWDAPTIISKIRDVNRRYDSIVAVENNGCFAPGTPVLTRERGYVSIEDVCVGEHTWTHRARWRRVLEVVPSENDKIVHARIAGGLPVSVTPVHQFWMRPAGRVPGRAGGQHRPTGEAQWSSIGFEDVPAYCALAAPTWPARDAVLELRETRRDPAMQVRVDEEVALFLGLYVAEGHRGRSQVAWTLNRRETHLADLIERVAARLAPGRVVSRAVHGPETMRVAVNSTRLSELLAVVGKSAVKTLPVEWLGWPLALRLAVVRGWLLGDGCLMWNNGRTRNPTRFFSGCSISRNWVMWVRSTLLEAGYAPNLSVDPPRASKFGAREVASKAIFTVRLSSECSRRLREEMTDVAEEAHWERGSFGASQASRTPVVRDGQHAWGRLRRGPGAWETNENTRVYNLLVEEDESFTAQDYVVHNCQGFIRQMTLAQDASIPLKPFTTGRNKAHPEHGLQSLFAEIANGAWLIPNDRRGRVHPNTEAFIKGCLYFSPTKHTDDALMACFFAREEARKFGALSAGMQKKNGAIGVAITSR